MSPGPFGRRAPAGRGVHLLRLVPPGPVMLPPLDEQGEVVLDPAALRRWCEAARPGDVAVYATAIRLTPEHAAGREAARLARAGLALLTQRALPGRVERAYRATRSSLPWPRATPRDPAPAEAPAETLDAVYDLLERAARFGRVCPTDAQLAERAGCDRATVAAALAELAEAGAILVRRVRAPTLRRVTIAATGMRTGAVR